MAHSTPPSTENLPTQICITVGQPTSNILKIQCSGHPSPQSQNSVFQYQPVTARRRTPPKSISNMQIPKLGSEQNQDENKIQPKEEKQKSKQEHYA